MFEVLTKRSFLRQRRSGNGSGNRGLVAALDVGTAKICCFISQIREDGSLDVVGVGHQISRGTRAGAIVDM